MRQIYHDELDEIGTTLVHMANLVGIAMQRATGALLNADLAAAEAVISGDPEIDALRAQTELRCFQQIARQQPVATDLRVLITSIHMLTDLERMGDLALHIAKVTRLRYPEVAVPDDIRDVIEQRGSVAHSLVTKVADVLAGRDVELAQAIEAED